MKKIILLLAFSNIAFTQNIKSNKDVEKVLDKLHLYAAEANAFFLLMMRFSLVQISVNVGPKLNSASMQLTECLQVRGGPIL